MIKLITNYNFNNNNFNNNNYWVILGLSQYFSKNI